MHIRYVHICMYMYVERMKKEMKKVSGEICVRDLYILAS